VRQRARDGSCHLVRVRVRLGVRVEARIRGRDRVRIRVRVRVRVGDGCCDQRVLRQRAPVGAMR